jgi:tRNA uridine 5-carboxymethylaminomethyl modification enzyme
VEKVVNKSDFAVIVIGAGHAGIEAACASARLQAKTLLITKNAENLGEMSCNPAIGGVAKGTIVKEIDALDGVMGEAIDESGIHFKILNSSKGAAVQSPRAQADRKLYKKAINKIVSDYPNLTIRFASVEDILIENNQAIGVVIFNQEKNISEKIFASSVVLTTGTFLSGVIHIGDKKTLGGRIGEKNSVGLSQTLKKHNFAVSRLKTGTPPRILASSIDFSNLEEQSGDNPATPFSEMTEEITTPQISCYITYTNEKTHQIIKDNLAKSAMYGGHISSLGPRYCPSIEDKIHRFFDKTRHQIFLEPEGLDSDLIYPNGISTSLPAEVQIEFLKSIKGLENSIITQAGYAIEYDFVDPRELKLTLETKKIHNLFFAGQINGTTGYEEAAGQGIIAGINAALKAKNSSKEFTLDRSQGYIGVMIDDLTTFGTSEPYRMLTSRAEYRLSLRADNADLRLTEKGIEIGCVSEKRKKIFYQKLSQLNEAEKKLTELKISPSKLKNFEVAVSQDGVVRNAMELMSFQKIDYDVIEKIWPQLKDDLAINDKIKKLIEIKAKYQVYLKKQQQDIEIFQKEENIKIPLDIDYFAIKSLSNEVKEKLSKFKPATIKAASSIQGITPAAIMAILIFIKNQ